MNAIATQTAVGWPGSPVVRLREIARRCESRQPLDPFLAQWLGEILNTFLDRGTESFEEVMGLRYGRGGLPWRRAEAIRERDAALRALSGRFFADCSLCARSREIEKLAIRYAASAWRRDRDNAEMPAHYAGKPLEFLWRAFKTGATMPLGERQIRNIVAT